MKICTILGTRPEIIKLSPLIPLLDKEFEHVLVHTGQHYDYNMDGVFFEELGLRKPDYLLGVGSASHAQQIAQMMIKIEEILLQEKPDAVIVFADPNTPLAGALVATKLSIPLIHLEAGCRSFNRKMPEEINRIVCDHCADLLLAPDEKAKQNLLCEGVSPEGIIIVGSTALEASIRNFHYAKSNKIMEKLGLSRGKFVIATLHRAENTTNLKILQELLEAIGEIASQIKLIFPLHPRTKKIIEENNLNISSFVTVIPPLSYLEMLNLLENCFFIVSDSGGLQEEAAALNTPCLILRNETEWTYLLDLEKNMLLGTNKLKIISVAQDFIRHPEKIETMKNIRLFLNTNTSQKIVEAIHGYFKR